MSQDFVRDILQMPVLTAQMSSLFFVMFLIFIGFFIAGEPQWFACCRFGLLEL
jgi:hypothetical protein